VPIALRIPPLSDAFTFLKLLIEPCPISTLIVDAFKNRSPPFLA
jgi:hypothetical protein